MPALGVYKDLFSQRYQPPSNCQPLTGLRETVPTWTSQIVFAMKLKIKKITPAAVIGVSLFSQSLQTESCSIKNAGAFLQSVMMKL